MPDYVDILPLLNQAAAALRDNELIQSKNIGLFETTSAIEIGEPRMDTGVYTEEEKNFPKLDVFQPLMPSEILWVMDAMLGLQVSYIRTCRNPGKYAKYSVCFHGLDEVVSGICACSNDLYVQIYPRTR